MSNDLVALEYTHTSLRVWSNAILQGVFTTAEVHVMVSDLQSSLCTLLAFQSDMSRLCGGQMLR